MSTLYPIVFSFKDLVAGNGFVAAVVIRGRAVLADEGDGFWMSGVNPGPLAGGGKERCEAFCAFKERYRSVLFDIAEEAASVAEFASEVEAFFHDTDDEAASAWDDARERVRAGEITTDLPKEAAADPVIEVFEVRPAQRDGVGLNDLGQWAEAA